MGTLHRFVLRTYLGPLVMTFFIVMFILLMQFLWKYIDDLVGKGLEFPIIAEILLYASAGMVPMALPLSTLLASLMTMGGLGEHNELLAMKSAGISLPRIMSPLVVVTLLITVGGVLFSNHVQPYTNLKISSLIHDVRQQRPDLQIIPGVFIHGIEGYSIKVAEKDHRTHVMHNIMIYDHRAKEGNTSVTIADSGIMRITADERHMILTLYRGATYQEMAERSGHRRSADRRLPARRNTFDEQTVILELKGFGFQRSNVDLFRNHARAMNLNQLETVTDSLGQVLDRLRASFHANLVNHYLLRSPNRLRTQTLHQPTVRLNTDSLFQSLPAGSRHRVAQVALENARAAKNYVVTSMEEQHHRGRFIARHQVEWHRKFALPFAVFVFFWIGAPLGAIIRKGGLGLPVVISVLFFVAYYVISITSEKFVRELIWQPFTGMWISTLILLPLGIFLTYKATNDSVILNPEFYLGLLKKFLRIGRKAQVGCKPKRRPPSKMTGLKKR